MIVDIVASIAVVAGSLLAALGSVGLLLFPDVLTRMHAATKAATVGVIATVGAVLLAIAALAALVRAVRGPSVADRMVAIDTLLFIGVGGLGVYIVRTGDTTYVSLLVMAVLTAFVSTVVVARYIETRTE